MAPRTPQAQAQAPQLECPGQHISAPMTPQVQAPQPEWTRAQTDSFRDEQSPVFSEADLVPAEEVQSLKQLVGEMASLPLGKTKVEQQTTEARMKVISAKIEQKADSQQEQKENIELEGLKEAATAGTFDLRGWIGQRFFRDHKAGSKKHAEYQDIDGRQDWPTMR